MIGLPTVRRAVAITGALAGVLVVSEVTGALAPHGGSGLPVPWPVLVQALAPACITALTAIGLVLIYRATRIINFAHAGFAGVASLLFYELLRFKHFPYLAALVLALLAGLAGGAAVELLLIRRFSRAPRLVLTVVTLALAQFLAGLAGSIPFLVGDKRPRAEVPSTPLSHFTWKLPLGKLNGNHVLLFALTLVVMAGLIVFFRYTSLGIAIRGAAENDDRAASLGVNTRLLSSLVWTIAAGLAAVAGIMQASISGVQFAAGAAAAGGGGASTGSAVAAAGVGSAVLFRAMAAAVIGGMDDLPVTVAAAVGLAMFEQSVSYAYGRAGLVDGLLLVVIGAVLLLKRERLARARDAGLGAWAATEEIRAIPQALASLPSVRSGVRRVQVVGALVLLAYPWVMSPSQTNLGSLFAIYGIVVLSLVVLTGWGGQISLGQFGFVAVGAVVGGALISRAHWPFPLALTAGSLAGMLVAILVGLPALRIRGLFLALTTLALAVAVASVGLNPNYNHFLPKVVSRPRFLWINMEDERAFYYLCLICLLLAVAGALSMRRSRTGRVLIAMRENERTAQSFGINLVRTRLATFALSGFLAAFAGVLFAAHQHRVAATSFAPEASIQIFLMAVIGGLGSIPGSLTGAVYLGLLDLSVSSAVARQLGSGLLLLLLLLVFPGGLGAAVFRLRDAVLRRVAIRRRIHVPSLLGDYGFVGGQMARVPLAPKLAPDGSVEATSPWAFELPSRIGAAGASQRPARWSF